MGWQLNAGAQTSCYKSVSPSKDSPAIPNRDQINRFTHEVASLRNLSSQDFAEVVGRYPELVAHRTPESPLGRPSRVEIPDRFKQRNLRWAEVSDAAQIQVLSEKLLYQNQTNPRGFLTRSLLQEEVKILIKNEMVLVHESENQVKAFLVIYDSTSAYGKTAGKWKSQVDWLNSDLKNIENLQTFNIRAVGSDSSVNPQTLLALERLGAQLVAEKKGVILGKVSINPLNELSLALHLAFGGRLVGTLTENTGQVWAVMIFSK